MIMIDWLKKKLCRHEFAIDDIEQTGSNVYSMRVRWPCSKCGQEFFAHCGLDITPKHGPVFRRESK